LQAALDSITLLKNNDTKIPNSKPLPIPQVASSRILVVGPSGNSLSNQCGGWSLHWQGALNDGEFSVYTNTTTVYTGLQAVTQQWSGIDLRYIMGCDFDTCNNNQLTNIASFITQSTNANTPAYVIAVVGEAPEAETPGDIQDLSLSASQVTLLQLIVSAAAASNVNVKLVMVLMEARPRVVPNQLIDSFDAVLDAYLPGLQGGAAIAQILVGLTNPSGKLPFTYPRTTGDLVPYWHRWAEDGKTDPLFAFGTGLSYTQFQYSNLRLSTPQLPWGLNLTVNVDVRNIGSIAGKEVVQLYLSDIYASVAPEVKLLKGFSKILLQSGERQTLTFTVTPNDMSFIGRNDEVVIEPGLFQIEVTGGDSNQSLQANFTLQPPTTDNNKQKMK